MGKFKPHKGLLKRIRVTKSGKIKGRVANGSHLRSGKTGRQMRQMSGGRYLQNYGIRKRINKLLGGRVPAAKSKKAETAAADAKE